MSEVQCKGESRLWNLVMEAKSGAVDGVEGGVDVEAQIVADVVRVKVSINDGIDNVEAVPGGKDDAVQLEVASEAFFVRLQLTI